MVRPDEVEIFIKYKYINIFKLHIRLPYLSVCRCLNNNLFRLAISVNPYHAIIYVIIQMIV